MIDLLKVSRLFQLLTLSGMIWLLFQVSTTGGVIVLGILVSKLILYPLLSPSGREPWKRLMLWQKFFREHKFVATETYAWHRGIGGINQHRFFFDTVATENGIVVRNRARLGQLAFCPWRDISVIEVFTDSEVEGEFFARLCLRNQYNLQVTLPWRTDFTCLIPASVGYRRL